MTGTSEKGAAPFTISLDGVDYAVVVEGDGRPSWTVTVNGRSYEVEPGEDGRVLVDGIAHELEVEEERVRAGDSEHKLVVSGFDLGPARSGPSAAIASPPTTGGGDGAIVAIMPGQVTRVLVGEGQQVVEGEAVCVLEAMKMENELRADRDGVVDHVYVRPGDDVEKGQVLIEIR